jgi:hypothetical protein
MNAASGQTRYTAACIAHSLDGVAPSSAVPSSATPARSPALTVCGSPPEGVITIPPDVRALTLPELPTMRPFAAQA